MADPVRNRARRQPILPLTIELRCPNCGYDLRGIPEDRCPECGFGFDINALRDTSQRAALIMLADYEAIFLRGLWLIGFSVMLWLSWWILPMRLFFVRSLVGPVAVAVILLYREYGSPRTWSELLIDWGLPLLLVGSAPWSKPLFELAQWALVVEMIVKLLTVRAGVAAAAPGADSPYDSRLRRGRAKGWTAMALGALIAVII